MELKESKRTLRIPKTMCDEFEERAVDTDIVLPDYCPDIAVILKCIMRPTVTARFQSGDRYTVDGTTSIRVLYLTEDRTTVYSHEVTQPFNASFRVSDAVQHDIEVKSDYVNCRATGPRRLDVHGAFRVFLKAYGAGEMAVFADPDRRDICCQTRTVSCTVPVSETDKSFVVSETIDLGTNAERLIYTDMTVSSCDCKTLTNKLIVKGTLSLKAVYAADQTMATALQEIPFSQIVDVEGLTDAWQCRVQVQVGENESYLQQNDRGMALLFMTCKLIACVRCSVEDMNDVVLDAYSVDRPLVCDTTPLYLTHTIPAGVNRLSLHQTAALPEGVTELVDVWGELKNRELKDSDSAKVLTCCVLVSMIARDDTGHLGYYERTVDFQTGCDADYSDMGVRLLGVSGNITGGQLRVQAELEQMPGHDASEMLTVVCDVVEDSQQAYQKTGAAIRIVYADVGETVWNIAKQHHSSVRDILVENDLLSDRISAPTMLMIPIM